MTGGQSLLLRRLQPHKLKKAGHNKWTFASPLREEKKASGTLTFDGDGVLIYDFGDETEGAADRILEAVGLTWPEVLLPRDGSISKPAHHDEKDAGNAPRLRRKRGNSGQRERGPERINLTCCAKGLPRSKPYEKSTNPRRFPSWDIRRSRTMSP